MPIPQEFEDIRCYEAEDLPRVFEELLSDGQFHAVWHYLYPDLSETEFKARLFSCTDVLDFQKKFLYSLIFGIMDKASTGLTMDADALESRSVPYTFVSNHRDIVLDSALLSALLVKNGFPTTVEIAIGDNLLIYPWIKHIVRLNKAFIVQRSLGLRETLLASQKMSRYMHYVLKQKQDPIWIAQREGRAKDSNDRTQSSVLKMLAMGGEQKSALDNLREMNIVPLTISYEYDPCDFLKAKEFQQKRDNPDHKKSRQDDLQNMQTGIFGFKGRVHYQMSPCINRWLPELADAPKAVFFDEVARRMDNDIFCGYRLYPNNYVAADLLENADRRTTNYTAADKERFEAYLQGQIEKIDLANKDEDFLREKMLLMYANPLFNQEKTLCTQEK